MAKRPGDITGWVEDIPPPTAIALLSVQPDMVNIGRGVTATALTTLGDFVTERASSGAPDPPWSISPPTPRVFYQGDRPEPRNTQPTPAEIIESENGARLLAAYMIGKLADEAKSTERQGGYEISVTFNV